MPRREYVPGSVGYSVAVVAQMMGAVDKEATLITALFPSMVTHCGLITGVVSGYVAAEIVHIPGEVGENVAIQALSWEPMSDPGKALAFLFTTEYRRCFAGLPANPARVE